jgi:hypothetical protein
MWTDERRLRSRGADTAYPINAKRDRRRVKVSVRTADPTGREFSLLTPIDQHRTICNTSQGWEV